MSHALPTILNSQGAADDLQTLADAIRRAKLTAPAIFILEAQKPLSGVLFHLALTARPIGGTLLGLKRWQLLEKLLSDRANIDTLLSMLEE